MTIDKTPPKKKNFWQKLTLPHSSIKTSPERRFATVLATLLLVLVPLYFLPEGIRAIIEKQTLIDILYFGSGVVILSVAYLFARSPYPRWGARITMLYFTLIPFAALVTQAERYAGENAKNSLIWTVPIMLMALVMFRPDQIKYVVAFNISIYLLIPALWDGLAYEHVLSTLWLVIATGGLMMVSAYVQNRYLNNLAREVEQSKINERRFREIFLGSPVALWEADFSEIKTRLDYLAKENGDIKSYILQNPASMEGAARTIHFLDANLEAVKLYEAQNVETLLQSLHKVVIPQAMLALRDGVIALWQEKSNAPIETIHKTLKEKDINVVIRFSVRNGYEDTWEYVNISIDDVTEARAAEASVRQLASAVEASGSSIVITNMNGAIEYANPAFSQVTGYTREEAMGENPRVLKSGQHPAEFYQEMWDALVKGDTWSGEIINKKKNGDLYWERASISPVKNDTGEVVSYVAVKDDITQAKEAEAEIQRQSEFFQNVIDGIDSPFYVLNVDDYSIALANEKARALGAARGNVCYKLTHKRDTPCDSKEHPCPLKQVLQHKEAFSVEHIHYRSDGTPYYVEVHGYPIFDKNGDVIQMIEYSIDITERKKAEEELRKLSSAAEQTDSGIVITNMEGIIEFANPAALKITGYSAKEFVGGTPNLLKSGEHDSDFYQELWGTIQKGEVWRGELINRRKDGSLYWESQTISPVKNNQGEITHYVAVKEDISKVKAAEKEIRTLSSATEQTASGIVITNEKGYIEFINPAFSAISGYELEDVLGKTLDIQRSDEHDESFYAQLDATLARGEIWKGEIINKRKNGSLYWEAQVISPITDDDGNIIHHVLVKEDITRRKELEQSLVLAHEEVLRASDMKTQLLANVSHDMRTPLGAILGYTEMLDADVFGKLNDEQAEATRAIAASSQRLLNFVSDLLNQAQIETGEIVINESLFEPQRLLDGLGGEISLAKTQGLIINTLVGDNLPKEITGDIYWLGQIIHNLLSNAIKFTHRGGKISIRLLRSGEHAWKLEVEDNGKGIPQEAKAYIFESFRQVDGSITREAHTGSGLGLSIVNHLVRLMRGEIRLESKLGKGSKFIVLLPLKENDLDSSEE